MARRKRKSEEVAEEVPTKEQPPSPPLPVSRTVSTRNLERPSGSIRIVRGRKDAK